MSDFPPWRFAHPDTFSRLQRESDARSLRGRGGQSSKASESNPAKKRISESNLLKKISESNHLLKEFRVQSCRKDFKGKNDERCFTSGGHSPAFICLSRHALILSMLEDGHRFKDKTESSPIYWVFSLRHVGQCVAKVMCCSMNPKHIPH